MGSLLLTLAIAVPLAVRPATAEPQRYKVDPDHTSVGFMVKHIGFAKVLGMFQKANGSFVFDEAKPAVSDIQVTIDANSVFTGHQKRDDHLRNQDFLWVEKFPSIVFKGTGAQQTGERTGKITGDLTIRGVTRPVTLDVIWNKSGEYPFGDKHHAVGISARTKIKRSEFDMTYAVAGDIVGDEVEIIIEMEGIRQPS